MDYPVSSSAPQEAYIAPSAEKIVEAAKGVTGEVPAATAG